MIKEIAKFTIPVAPITKKNSPQIVKNRSTGRFFLLPSKQYLNYEKSVEYFIPQLNINYPVNVEMRFFVPTKRKCDLVNLQESCLDVLVKYKCIEDDNYTIVETQDGSRVEYDKENPRTEVIITRKE